MNGTDPLDRDRIGILTGVLLLGLALSRLLRLADAGLDPAWLPSALPPARLLPWLQAGILVGLAGVGTLSLIRNHPRVRQQTLDAVAMYCLTPVLLAGGLSVVLGDLVDWELWVFSLVAAGGLLALAITLEYFAVSPRVRATASWQWGMLMFNHLAALVLLEAIVGWQVAAITQSVVAFVATGLLAARLLWALGGRLDESFLLAGVGAVIMAQATWAISYWPLGRLRTGLLLLVLYYVTVGLLLQHRRRQLDLQAVRAYGLVALGAVLVVILLPF